MSGIDTTGSVLTFVLVGWLLFRVFPATIRANGRRPYFMFFMVWSTVVVYAVVVELLGSFGLADGLVEWSHEYNEGCARIVRIVLLAYAIYTFKWAAYGSANPLKWDWAPRRAVLRLMRRA